MTIDIPTIDNVLAAIDQEEAKLVTLMSSLDEEKVNAIPYEGSWTPVQLLNHVEQSNYGMGGRLAEPSAATDRDPAEKIARFKTVLQDETNKLKSPDFIIPGPGPYEKKKAIEDLQASFKNFRENARKATLNEVVEGLPTGPITKLEIIHFVLYHTQRHAHQMERICKALEEKG